MSVHLVEEGLAMIAGQSSIAGPSVCVTSGPASHLSRLHLLSVDRGNKKGANRSRLQPKRLSGCLPGVDPRSRRAAVVRTGSARALVTLFVQPIVRESPRQCKPFCITSGPAPSHSRGPRARCASTAPKSRPGRGVPACRAGQPRYIALRDAAPPRHATRSASCSVGLGTAAP